MIISRKKMILLYPSLDIKNVIFTNLSRAWLKMANVQKDAQYKMHDKL